MGYAILHPTSRLCFDKFWNGINSIFISQYHELILDDNVTYNNFTSSFQASLGLALLSGFKKLHIVGFDYWLLDLPNPLRWYSNLDNPQSFDKLHLGDIEKERYNFLKIASNFFNISIISYLHYK